MRLVAHRDDGKKAGCQQLLALHQLRRDLEHGADTTGESMGPAAMAVTTRSVAIRELLELIDALDRRVPQVHRAGEAAIAKDAAALKERALKRIEELERESRRKA